MRVETTFDGVFEFYWDGQDRLRGWNSYYSSDQRNGEAGHMLIDSLRPTFGGRSMEIHWYYHDDDPEWRSIEYTDLDVIERVLINGEEVYNRDRI